MLNKIIKATTAIFLAIFILLILVSIKVDRIADLSYFDTLLFLELAKYFIFIVIPTYLYLIIVKIWKK